MIDETISAIERNQYFHSKLFPGAIITNAYSEKEYKNSAFEIRYVRENAPDALINNKMLKFKKTRSQDDKTIWYTHIQANELDLTKDQLLKLLDLQETRNSAVKNCISNFQHILSF